MKNTRHEKVSRNFVNCKPFLRWAGGKRWLIKQLDNFLPAIYNQYHEPFIGGGSIFFHLNPDKAFISDFNSELIEAYIAIKNNPQDTIKYIQSL